MNLAAYIPQKNLFRQFSRNDSNQRAGDGTVSINEAPDWIIFRRDLRLLRAQTRFHDRVSRSETNRHADRQRGRIKSEACARVYSEKPKLSVPMNKPRYLKFAKPVSARTPESLQ